MAASYPGAIKSFTQVVDGTTKLVALLFNAAYNEIEAIETELGTDVAGSLTDLKTRLAVSINNDGTISASIGEAQLASSAVSQTRIKQGETEQSHAQTGIGTSSAGKTFGNYGFTFQGKCTSTQTPSPTDYCDYTYQRNTSADTSYLVRMLLEVTNTTAGGGTITGYMKNIRVTSSGPDHFIYLLTLKNDLIKDGHVFPKGLIVGAYSSEDHPSTERGEKLDDVEHPFSNYDENMHEIILVDNEILNELKEKVTRHNSLLEIIIKEYDVDFDSAPVFEPRESIGVDEYGDLPGEVIKEIKTPNWAKIKIKKDKVYLKKQTMGAVPSYIKYKKIKAKPKKGGV